MGKIVGLDGILKEIDKFTISTMPHSLVLVGEKGSGKKLVLDRICKKFKFNLVDISEEVSNELIDNIYLNPNICMYLIDVRKFTDTRKQNSLLKFIEEPSANVFITIICDDKTQLLNTIINRCRVLYLDKYSQQQLKLFQEEKLLDGELDTLIEDKYLGSIIRTPGDVIKISTHNIDLKAAEELCDKICEKIQIAPFYNILSIVERINFKDEFDKIDSDIFMRILYEKYVNKYLATKDNRVYAKCSIIKSTIDKIKIDYRLSKKNLFTNMLIDLWRS